MDARQKRYRVRSPVDMKQKWGTWVEVEATNAIEARAKAAHTPISEFLFDPVSDAAFEAGPFADEVQSIDEGPNDAFLGP